ncbi:hypothetical protein [Sulfurospirillum sp. UBA4051]|uniref:hypothetical protein n=1 Tax=Sulfurospirillum sp. UBA4051 TaxID=1947595 RepID=UPI0025DD6B53|nr:hypothetical protein [Sulfurospirillum sp. UBA4051]
MQKVFLALIFFITITHASSNDFVLELIQNDLEKALNLCKFHSKFPAVSQTCFHFFNGELDCKIVA